MLKYVILALAVLSMTEALLKIQIPSFKKPKHFLFESTYPVHVINRYPVPTPVPVPVHIKPIIQTVRQPVYIEKPVVYETPVPVPVAAPLPIAPVPDCYDNVAVGGGIVGGIGFAGGYGGGAVLAGGYGAGGY